MNTNEITNPLDKHLDAILVAMDADLMTRHQQPATADAMRAALSAAVAELAPVSGVPADLSDEQILQVAKDLGWSPDSEGLIELVRECFVERDALSQSQSVDPENDWRWVCDDAASPQPPAQPVAGDVQRIPQRKGEPMPPPGPVTPACPVCGGCREWGGNGLFHHAGCTKAPKESEGAWFEAASKPAGDAAMLAPCADLLQRASDLVEKCQMPWHEAERLALDEAGITEVEIEELQGECQFSTILTGDEITAYTRAILVHGCRLVRQPDARAELAAKDAEIAEAIALRDSARDANKHNLAVIDHVVAERDAALAQLAQAKAGAVAGLVLLTDGRLRELWMQAEPSDGASASLNFARAIEAAVHAANPVSANLEALRKDAALLDAMERDKIDVNPNRAGGWTARNPRDLAGIHSPARAQTAREALAKAAGQEGGAA